MLTGISENIQSRNFISANDFTFVKLVIAIYHEKLNQMSKNLTSNTAKLKMRFATITTILIVPLSVFGQELGEPLIGPEILSETVQIEHNSFANCALQNTGSVFCWGKGRGFSNTPEIFISDVAGSWTLNAALNNDIASITLDSVHLCGIGRESGIACVAAVGRSFSANGSVQFPPEPDASYLSISDLGPLNSGSVCAIQADNRVVCWGSTLGGSDNVGNIPPEAAFLKQVDVESSRACGIDLNSSVVCWGRPRLNAGVDAHFGDVDLAMLGPVKQISLGRSGACLIDMNDRLECFGEINSFTDIFSDVTLSSIEVGGTFSFNNANILCYETTSGEKNCQTLTFSVDGTSSDSVFSADADTRLISLRNGVCYVTRDDMMKCSVSGDSLDQNQFPTAPQSLSFDLYSDTQGELTWTRPSVDISTDDFALGYEIFRDGVLIDRLPVVTSYFDSNTNPNASYEVRATRGLIAGTSAFVNADGSDGPGLPIEPAPPTEHTNPTTPGIGEIELAGAVYSSSAIELFWNRTPFADMTYNVFRDGVLVRENSPAISHFNGQLPPDNTFVFEVVALLNGDAVASSTIKINTSTGSVSEPTASEQRPPAAGPQQSDVAPIELTGDVYSSTALELSWNRDDIPGVTYNIFRDGQLIRENSPAISQFQSGLLPSTSYLFTVTPFLNGIEQASDTIVLSTRSI